MRLLYTIGIWFYTLGVRFAALCGHRNARLMVQGWRECVNGLMRQCVSDNTITQSRNHATRTAWFHAASLGEFEQARPVLEAYKQRHPESRIVVSFFSPSGYEVRKNYALADAVIYLPMDTLRNARRLVEALQPTIAFFVKYEFWFNYLDELKKHGIPTYIFSSIFRPQQYFFKWYGGWFRRQLQRCFTHLFVQNTESLELLKSHGIIHCSIAGDTRFDRVHQIALAAEPDAVAERFLDGYDGRVLVGGSTWPPDEQILAHVRDTNGDWFPGRIILAPHVIGEEHLKQIEVLFPESIRYSVLKDLKDPKDLKGPKLLIIDNIGILSKLYRYADVAYIGGGFGVGIHNILEAVTFGKPVFFGPNYHKFQEAHDIIAHGGGWSIHGENDMEEGDFMRLLTHPEELQRASKACTDYMSQNLGSTEKILSTIEK